MPPMISLLPNDPKEMWFAIPSSALRTIRVGWFVMSGEEDFALARQFRSAVVQRSGQVQVQHG
jgi:hypothetical protein